MTDYVCLARRFPAKGIDGVLGVPVTSPDEIDSYLEELPVPVDADKVRFVRLTAIPEKSQGHLKSGDVVVKYSGLSERFLDVLRPVETASMNTNYKSGEIDWPLAEEARGKALESGEWSLTCDDHQVAICDPSGRLAVLRGAFATPRRLFKYAFAVLLQTERDRRRVTYDPYKGHLSMPSDKPRWAWATFRFLHHYIMSNGPVVPNGQYHQLKKMLKRHHRVSMSLPTPAIGPYLRLHTRRTHKHTQEFWKRAQIEYLKDPDSLPRALSFVASKKGEARWVRVELSEVDEILRCVSWPEWNDCHDPFHFSTFLNHRIAKWN